MLVEIRNIEDDGETISCTYYPERKINDEKRLTISKKNRRNRELFGGSKVQYVSRYGSYTLRGSDR